MAFASGVSPAVSSFVLELSMLNCRLSALARLVLLLPMDGTRDLSKVY